MNETSHVETFSTRLAQLEDAILLACRQAGRKRESVRLMAVSKTHPARALAEAVAVGLTLFGENRVQEFEQKSEELKSLGVASAKVHLIGHLQSNKAARAAQLFDGIDSLDSLKLAERLDEAARRLQKQLPVLLEIKLSAESTKTGFLPQSAALDALLERLPDLKFLTLRGLMTIAPLTPDATRTRACFAELRRLRERLSREHPRLNFEELSMGMSGDFALAIEEGSTCIRVGSALFGRRPQPQLQS